MFDCINPAMERKEQLIPDAIKFLRPKELFEIYYALRPPTQADKYQKEYRIRDTSHFT